MYVRKGTGTPHKMAAVECQPPHASGVGGPITTQTTFLSSVEASFTYLWAKIVSDDDPCVAHELRDVGALPPRSGRHVKHALSLDRRGPRVRQGAKS